MVESKRRVPPLHKNKRGGEVSEGRDKAKVGEGEGEGEREWDRPSEDIREALEDVVGAFGSRLVDKGVE